MKKEMIYYPGCALYDKAKDFDLTTKKSFKALGVELKELSNWTCCGTSFPLIDERLMGLVAPVRNLINAVQYGNEITTGCSCCYNALKRANNAMRNDAEKRKRINAFLEIHVDNYYSGQVDVLHLLEILRDKIGFDEIQSKTKKDLSKLKLAPFYGCLLLRPYDEMKIDKLEQPRILDDLIDATGAQAIDYPYKTACCGSYLVVKFPEISLLSSQKIILSAKQAGAEAMITSCPLCLYNLKRCQLEMSENKQIPVFYFTEILADALGV